MDPRRILITGISGVGVRESVAKLVADVRMQYHPDVLEARLEEHFYEELRSTGLLRDAGAENEAELTIRALALPKPILRERYGSALEQVMDRYRSDRCHSNVFMHGHACFYHQQTREFFVLANTDRIAESFRPDMVITLIDDLENIHQRLRAEGHLFQRSEVDYSGVSGLAEAFHDLGMLMHWRAAEFSASEQIARKAHCPHYLIAVKHPIRTVARLIFEPHLHSVYISHPITEPRAQLNRGNVSSFDEFSTRLGLTCATLRSRAVLFEPTTIDELRFRRFLHPTETGNRTSFIPILTQRWPLPGPAEQLLWDKIDDLGPFEHFSDEEIDDFIKAHSEGAAARSFGLLSIASALTNALVGEIGDQISARDYKLVEQSDMLFVIRPLFGGRYSEGVRREILHYSLLAQLESPQPRFVWIFTTTADEQSWKAEKAFGWIYKQITIANPQSLQSLETKEKLRAEVEGLDFSQSAAKIAKDLYKIAIRSKLLKTPEPSNPLSGTRANAATEMRDLWARELESELQVPYARYEKDGSSGIIFAVKYGEEWPSELDIDAAFALANRSRPSEAPHQLEEKRPSDKN